MRYIDIIQMTKEKEGSSVWQSKNQRLSSIKGSSLDAIRSRQNGLIGTTTSLMLLIAKKVLGGFIKKYGKMQTVLFPQDSIFTTKTKIHSTTTLKTLNACQSQIIMPTTFQLIPRKSWLGVENGLTEYDRVQAIGIVQKRDGRGTKNLGICLGITWSILQGYARIAVQNISTPRWETQKYTAPINAKPLLAINQALITKPARARGVVNPLCAIATRGDVFALATARLNGATPNRERRRCSVQYAIRPLTLANLQRGYVAHVPVQIPCVALITKKAHRQAIYSPGIHNKTTGRTYAFSSSGFVVDADRYACAYFDLKPTSVRYSNRVY